MFIGDRLATYMDTYAYECMPEHKTSKRWGKKIEKKLSRTQHNTSNSLAIIESTLMLTLPFFFFGFAAICTMGM